MTRKKSGETAGWFKILQEELLLPLAQILENPENPRTITEDKYRKLLASIREFPEMLNVRRLVIDEAGIVLGGNMRLKALRELQIDPVPVIRLTGLSEDQKREFIVKDNLSYGAWDWEELANKWDDAELVSWGMDVPVWGEDLGGASSAPSGMTEESGDPQILSSDPPIPSRTLAERYLVPPFSVLDTKQGYWRDRQEAWKALGIKSEIGRGSNLLGFSSTVLGAANSSGDTPEFGGRTDNPEAVIPNFYHKLKSGMSREEIIEEWEARGSSAFDGTSIFDPALCEILYRWFAPEGGRILDPFAGGSVRGIVAGKLGRDYLGIELREEQVAANREQAREILGSEEASPVWISGDSLDVLQDQPLPGPIDFLFSCPPYHDLEKYSEDPRDLSALSWEEFLQKYREIIRLAVQKLEDNRFACFVVSEIRHSSGFYKGFVAETIRAFEEAGALFYNDLILLNSPASASIRAPRIFGSLRKCVRIHQNVLVFFKGDPEKIREVAPALDLDPAEAFQQDPAQDLPQATTPEPGLGSLNLGGEV